MNEELKQSYAAALHRAIDNTLGTEPSNNEPVALVNNMCNDSIDWKVDPLKLEEGTPLYTHPAKTLTDEEIDVLASKHLCYQIEGSKVSGVFEFARAILRKAQDK